MQVRGAELKDGLLSIELVREIPDAMKPRRIEITGSQPRQIVDQDAATAHNENDEGQKAA